MPPRGRDRTPARALPQGWDEGSAEADADRASALPRGPSPGRAPEAPGPSHRRRSLLVLATLAVLVLVLVVALPRLIAGSEQPEQLVGEFLQAVVDGDVEALREHVRQTATADDSALTAEILHEASDRVEDFEIRDVEIDAGTATVTADLLGGGRREEATFTLHASADGPFSILTWELAPVQLPELRLSLPYGVEEIEISGVPVAVATASSEGVPVGPRTALQLLPGTYEITIPVTEPWVEIPQLALTLPPVLGSPSDTVAAVQFELSEAGRQEAQDTFADWIETCAASTAPAPDGCPFAVPTAAQEEGLSGTWSVTEAPQIAVASAEDFYWIVHGTGSAEFTPDGPETADPVEVRYEIISFVVIDPEGALFLGPSSDGSVSFAHCHDAETGELSGTVPREDPDAPVNWEDCR